MAYWKILQLEVNTSFRPGSGQSWNSKKEYQYKDLKAGTTISLEEFQMNINELTEDGMKGSMGLLQRMDSERLSLLAQQWIEVGR